MRTRDHGSHHFCPFKFELHRTALSIRHRIDDACIRKRDFDIDGIRTGWIGSDGFLNLASPVIQIVCLYVALVIILNVNRRDLIPMGIVRDVPLDRFAFGVCSNGFQSSTVIILILKLAIFVVELFEQTFLVKGLLGRG